MIERAKCEGKELIRVIMTLLKILQKVSER